MRGTVIVKDQSYGLLIALPAILVLTLIIIFPMLYSLYLSFVPLELLNPNAPRRFVGFQSYLAVLKDARFSSSLAHTLVFVAITMTVELLLGLGIALLLNQSELKAKGLLRTLLVLPLMVAPIVSGLQWRWIFADQYGILNHILGALRLPTPVWLGSQITAMTTIVVANLWVATPFVFMVLLAGLQGMPEEPIEAAIIDGTSWFQRLWHVVLPMLRPALGVALLIRLADAIRIFDIVYILTGGGPGDSTQVFSTYIFRISYGSLDLSQGAAGSFIMVFITAVISLIMARRFRSSYG
jgi:multiple sugar transport system permease protein